MLSHSLTRTILTFGLGLGILRIGISMVAVFIFGPIVFFESLPLAGLLLAVMIAGMIYTGVHIRDRNGGLLSWGKGAIYLFSVYAIAGLLVVGYNALSFHVIQPEWLAGVPAEHVDRLEIGNGVYEYISSLIMGGFLALIFGYFLKRESVRVTG